MNDDVLYEVIKYLDSPVDNGKVSHAQHSSENTRRMMRLNGGILERKLSGRPTVSDLRMLNIYRDRAHRIDFTRIHKKLSDVFHRRGSPPFKNISPSIASTAKVMDFKLKKILLASRFRNRK